MVPIFRWILLVIGVGGALPAVAAAQTTPNLYQRLGRYDGIAAFSDEFLKNLGEQPSLGRFFDGLADDSRRRLRQHVVDFLCEMTGGPCFYLGRDMKTAHQGLALKGADWEAGVKALLATLDAFEVNGPTRDEVIAAVQALKKDIVE